MSIHNTTQLSDTPPMQNPEPNRSSATKPMMVLIAVIGGIALLVVVATTVFSSALGLNRGSATTTADTNGVSTIDIDATATKFDLEFADVSEATLETSGLNADGWHLGREGNELVVHAPDRWMDWCFFNCGVEDNQVTLTLPQELNDGHLSAELELSGGQLVTDGDFDRLGVELNAGEVNINGSARALDTQVNAGSGNLNLADVQTAELEVSAGRLITELTGDAPEQVSAEVSAGRLDLAVPDTAYAVNSQVSAGNLDNQLQTTSAADHRIDVDVSAGNAVLRPGSTTTEP